MRIMINEDQMPLRAITADISTLQSTKIEMKNTDNEASKSLQKSQQNISKNKNQKLKKQLKNYERDLRPKEFRLLQGVLSKKFGFSEQKKIQQNQLQQKKDDFKDQIRKAIYKSPE